MSRSRAALCTAAVLVLGVAAWIRFGREGEREIAPQAPPSEGEAAPGLAPAPQGDAQAPPAGAPPPTTDAPALRGEVLREDGRPAEGASVTAFRLAASFTARAADPGRRAVADAAGRFAFEDVSPGAFGVHARLAGSGSASVPLVRVAARGDTTVALRLGGERGIAGRVEDVEGRPVAGARVTADAATAMRRFYRGVLGEFLHPRVDVAATTGADGRFALPSLEAEPHDVEVVGAGFLPARAWTVPVPTTDLVVRLTRGGTVRGVVTVSSPAPPATVRVWTVPASVEAKPSVAGGEAAFLLDGLKPGPYRVLAAAPGCTQASARVDVAAGETPPPVRLLLAAGTPVSGSVRARDDGAPIPDAAVALSWVEREGHGASYTLETTVRTDGRGAWSASLRPGEWIAQASKEGWSAPETAEDPPPVVVGADPVTLDLVLVPSPVIEGVVLFADGPPVARARVWISSMGTNPLATTSGPVGIGEDDDATTDAEGRFRIEGVATYGRYALTAAGPGGATATTQGVVFEAGSTVARARITIQRVAATGARVEGRVLDEAGSPVAGAVVRFARGTSVTSADGTFAREAVPEGTYRARYGAVGRALGLSPPFAVGPRDAVRLPPWTLAGRGVVVRGTVRTTGGRPVADAQVTVWFHLGEALDALVLTAGTSPDGRYAVEGPALSEGTITVQARAEDLQFVEVRPTLPLEADVDFTLGGYATATASLSFSGAPAPVDAHLVFEAADDPAAPVHAEWDREASALRVRGIVPGRRRLRLTADGYAPIMTDVLEAREGETIALGARRFTAGATFAGRILDAEGKPWVGLQVNLDEPFLYVDTDADGRFRIEHVPPGTWKVGFAGESAPRPSPTFTATFAEGRTLEIERRLPR